MKSLNDAFRKVEDLEDGSTVYEVEDIPEITEEVIEQSPNLAIGFPEDGLKKLSQHLLEELENDIKAREASREVIKAAEPYLGFGLESKDLQFFGKHASKTVDLTLPTALIRYVSIASNELLGREAITDYKITGQSTPELEDRAETIKDYFNIFLTTIDRGYRDDFKQCIIYNGFEGSAYKKVYYDELLKRPKARLILPEDFLIDMNCTSILESNRLTHCLKLSKRDILLKQKVGVYRDVELSYLSSPDDSNNSESNSPNSIGVTSGLPPAPGDKKDTRYVQYEIHTFIDLSEYKNKDSTKEDKNIPLPYIITIDKFTKEVLSIYANIGENLIEPKEEFFVKYTYLTGFGIDGLGLAHIIGTSAISMTKIQNRLIDAATLQNLPAGFRQRGAIKGISNELDIGPAQFIEIDTNGIPLKDFFMPLPFNGPSPVLRELKLDLLTATKELASTSEMGMLDSKEAIATGTMLMALEHSNRIQSAVLKALYESFSHELQLLYKIFKKTLGTITFDTPNGKRQLSGEDFVDEIMIIPACDPSINSTVQKMMRANTIMANASNAPEYYNMPAVLRMNYKEQGLDDETIEQILKPEPQPEEVKPVDPVTGVSLIIEGKPVDAFMWQNHPAYILVYASAMQRPELQDKPQVLANLDAVITKHQAMQYVVEAQQALGMQLPPLDQLQDPEVQNAIAFDMAQALEELGATDMQQDQTAQLDPNVMAEIEQKQAETDARLEIATQRTELEFLKTEMNLEIEKLKTESSEYLAMEKIASAERLEALKAEVELVKIKSEEDTADLRSQIDFITKQGAKQNEYKQAEHAQNG